MKKKIILISVILIVLIGTIAGIIYIKYTKEKEQKDLDSRVILINGAELQERMENEETFMVIFTGKNCAHCQSFLPKFKKILKEYDLECYDIVLEDLSKEQRNFIDDLGKIEGTPTIMFFKNGEEVSVSSRLVGDVGESKVIDKLKVMGYIEK